jgi:riboflavin synthase
MFTGIVTGVGRVESLEDGVLLVRPPEAMSEGEPWKIGESVAVDGCCLTIAGHDGPLRFDLSPETIARTGFRRLRAGSLVNLERAMRLGDRFGGHIVQGHVDATGEIVSIRPEADSFCFTFRAPEGSARYLIDKGSITIDGISLTVVEPRGDLFDVWIIPHTMRETNLGAARPGDPVNIEFDVLAKHVEKLLAEGLGDRRP